MQEVLTSYLDWSLILIGSLLGSVRANIKDNTNKSLCYRLFDIALGVFCGVVVAGEYGSQFSHFISAMLALVSAMIGSNILDIIAEVSPNLVRKYIKDKFK